MKAFVVRLLRRKRLIFNLRCSYLLAHKNPHHHQNKHSVFPDLELLLKWFLYSVIFVDEMKTFVKVKSILSWFEIYRFTTKFAYLKMSSTSFVITRNVNMNLRNAKSDIWQTSSNKCSLIQINFRFKIGSPNWFQKLHLVGSFLDWHWFCCCHLFIHPRGQFEILWYGDSIWFHGGKSVVEICFLPNIFFTLLQISKVFKIDLGFQKRQNAKLRDVSKIEACKNNA